MFGRRFPGLWDSSAGEMFLPVREEQRPGFQTRNANSRSLRCRIVMVPGNRSFRRLHPGKRGSRQAEFRQRRSGPPVFQSAGTARNDRAVPLVARSRGGSLTPSGGLDIFPPVRFGRIPDHKGGPPKVIAGEKIEVSGSGACSVRTQAGSTLGGPGCTLQNSLPLLFQQFLPSLF